MPIISLKNYKPIKDELYRERIVPRIIADPTFYRVFRVDKTKAFFSVFKNIVNPNYLHDDNMVIQVSGDSGSGKSQSVMSIGKIVYKEFGNDNMFFFDQTILDKVSVIPKHTLIVRDENPAKGIFGTGSSRMSGIITVVAESCRKFGLSLIFVEPSFQEVSVAKYYLETVDMGKCGDQRVVRMGLREPRTLTFIGCVLVPVINNDDPDWVAYNERKDKFIEQIRKQDFSDAKSDWHSIGEELLKKLDPEIYRTKKEVRLYVESKYPSYTTKEIENICTAIEIARKKQYMGDDNAE